MNDEIEDNLQINIENNNIDNLEDVLDQIPNIENIKYVRKIYIRYI